MIPTVQELINEIEKGPLAAQLAPLWNTVFAAPAEARPDEAREILPEKKAEARAKVGAWEVKTHRAGRLHPDAAFEIHRLLSEARFKELGWDGFPWKLIKRAKDSTK